VLVQNPWQFPIEKVTSQYYVLRTYEFRRPLRSGVPLSGDVALRDDTAVDGVVTDSGFDPPVSGPGVV